MELLDDFGLTSIGADLENMVNQAALKAAIDECTSVTMEHFDFARDKVIMGKCVSMAIGLLTVVHVTAGSPCRGETKMLSSVPLGTYSQFIVVAVKGTDLPVRVLGLKRRFHQM